MSEDDAMQVDSDPKPATETHDVKDGRHIRTSLAQFHKS